MVGGVLLFAGFIVLGAGIVVFFAGAGAAFALPAGILILVGGFLCVLGFISRIRGAAAVKQNAHIMRTGVETEGTVVFVDRNFYVLVNKRPVYSVVEYTFKDASGKEYTRRIDTVPADLTIRNKVEVGSKVKVKYLPENPAASVFFF